MGGGGRGRGETGDQVLFFKTTTCILINFATAYTQLGTWVHRRGLEERPRGVVQSHHIHSPLLSKTLKCWLISQLVVIDFRWPLFHLPSKWLSCKISLIFLSLPLTSPPTSSLIPHPWPLSSLISPDPSHPSPLPLTSHLSPLTSHLSPLTYHLSPITYHLSPITYHLSPFTSLRSLLSALCSPLSALRSPLSTPLSPLFHLPQLSMKIRFLGVRWGMLPLQMHL